MSDPSTPSHLRPPPNTQLYDRTTGLIVFGILELLAGAGLALLGILSALVTAFLPEAERAAAGLSPRTMFGSVATYGLLGLAFMALGVGSFLARRWSRPLSLVAGWAWTAVMGLAALATAIMLPAMAVTDMPSMKGLDAPVLVATGIFMAFVFLAMAVPGVAMILFYRSPHVKATVDWKDQHPRWTDGVPLRVVGTAVIMWWGAISCLVGTIAYPFAGLGTVLTGVAAAVAWVVLAVLLAVLGKGILDRRLAAWWTTLGLVVAMTISGIVTFLRGGLAKMYDAMGVSGEQVVMAEAMMSPPVLVAVTVGGLAVMVAWLLYVKGEMRPAGRA